jgi:N-acetylneuraminic acid mutarotase
MTASSLRARRSSVCAVFTAVATTAVLLAAPAGATTSASWRTRAPMSDARAFAATTSFGEKVYVVGGFSAGDIGRTTQVYTPATNAWKRRAPLPAARWLAAASEADGKVFVIGGSTGRFQTSATTYAFDPTDNAWTKMSSLPQPVESGAAVTVTIEGSETILLFGGVDTDGVPTETVYAYDVTADSWSDVGASPALSQMSAVVLLDGTVAVLGGWTFDGDPSLATWVYDPALNSFASKADMLSNTLGTAPAALGTDGLLYATGLNATAKRVDVFDPVGNTWSTSAPDLETGQTAASVAEAGNAIYTIGGLVPGGSTAIGRTVRLMTFPEA